MDEGKESESDKESDCLGSVLGPVHIRWLSEG